MVQFRTFLGELAALFNAREEMVADAGVANPTASSIWVGLRRYMAMSRKNEDSAQIQSGTDVLDRGHRNL